MNLAPAILERFGRLTVLSRITSPDRGPRYRCACVCGFQGVYAKARQLMRGEVTSCKRCAR